MRKLFALLMALIMTVQLVTPAAAESLDSETETTTFATEEATETTEAPVEAAPAPTETTQEVTVSTPEESSAPTEPQATTVATEPTSSTEETTATDPTEETTEPALDLFAEDEDVIASGECGADGDNLTWVLTEDGTLTISGSGDMKEYNYGHISLWNNRQDQITAVILEPGVSRIGDRAFLDCSNLTSVTIPESVTSIGNSAFSGCSSLTNVTIPDSVTSIGNWAFGGCRGLASVTIPAGVTSIGDRVFYSCSSLTSVTIPQGVTSIGSSAFSGCSNLVSVTIPEGVTTIGGYAFSGCSSLMGVTIPEGVTKIEEGTFHGCTKLANVILPEGLLSVEHYYGNGAFENCTSLKNIEIPGSVTSIGRKAFKGCRSLTSVTIPEGVTSIGSSAFSDCSNLVSVTIPEGVTEIEGETFYGCAKLENVTLPDGLLSIGFYSDGHGAFEYCSSLKNIVIPGSVTRVGERAFYGCSGLTSVTIMEGVKTIDEKAFHFCSSLTSVTIPESVTSIGVEAFSWCSSLSRVTIPKYVMSIKSGSFYKCTSLKSVTLPEKLRRIEGDDESYGAFEDCTSLKSIIIPGNVISIGYAAFACCSGLTSVTIPEGVASIDEDAFTGCSSLTSVVIPESVTSIGAYVFNNCSSLNNVTIPKGVTRVSCGTFRNCSSLISVMIPKGVTSIGDDAFYGCSSLTSMTIPESVTSIGEDVFYGCSSLASMTIPDCVASLGRQAFYGCSSLSSVTIPESVTSIGASAFSDCSKLKHVYYGGSELQWEEIEIKDGNSALISATIHYSSTHIHNVEHVSGKPASCTENGNLEYWRCLICGEYFIDEDFTQSVDDAGTILPALGHAMVLTEAKAATCTEDGNNAYYTCGNCHKVFQDEQGEKEATTQAEVLPALGHTMAVVNTTAPTCTGKGNRLYYTCKTCGKAFKDKAGLEATTPAAEAVPALGHTMAKTDAVAPTCTEKGSNAYYTCETCEKVFKDVLGKQETTVEAEVLEALGHSMVLTEAKESTCTETGNNTYYTCKTCGKVYKDEVGEKETTVSAETIPALGHTMTKTEAVAPSCTEVGNNTYYTCKVCGKVYKDQAGTQETTTPAEIVSALGHTMVKTDAVAPTCTEKGSNVYYTCEICGKVFKDEAGKQETTVEAEVLEALGHSMVLTEAKEPTCTETGNNLYYTCKTCGKVYQDEAGEKETTVSAETIPALGHTMTKTDAVAPTCTEPGNNAYYTCDTCHKVYKDQAGKQETTEATEFLPALGHDMERTKAVAPTHTSTGNNAYYTCKTCHKVFRDEQGTTETTPEQETLPRLSGIDSGTCGDLQWLLSDENILTISGEGRIPDYSGTNLAPWYVYHKQIKGLVLEEGVTAIGSFAFYDCGALTEVQFPKTLRTVGSSSFAYCDSLRLLDLSKVPETMTEKTLDLSGLAKLAAPLDGLVKPSFVWKLETVPGQEAAETLAKLEGTKLEALRTGTFRLVCREENTGLTGYADLGAETTTVITSETEQLTSGQSLELKAVAMPFGTELAAQWSLAEASKAYAEISDGGLLTAKAVTAPVQVTVKAEPEGGEAPAEKTLWVLPKTTAIGILADGSLVGETLTAELTEKTELQLSARIQPEGAKTEVTWSSSEESVATVDKAGKVLLLKPGTTEITAKSLDGSGLEAKLTLEVQYLDGAQTLTLSADVPETGLEPGMQAQLTLSGESAFEADKVEFAIVQGSGRTATVDETGLLTAGEIPGTVKVKAMLKGDPLERSAEVTVTVIPTLVRALTLEPQVSQSWGYAKTEAGEVCVYGGITKVVGQNRTFQIGAQGKDYREHWSEAANLTFESSDLTVARVDAKGLVTLTAREAGECVITVRCTDTLGTEARLHIVLQDSAPRLESTKVTLNGNLTAGVTTGLVESCGNTIQSVTLYDYNKTTKRYEEAPSESFAAEAEDGTLTVRALKVQDKGTYQLKLVVDCLGGSYDFTLQVKVANSLPKVTVKQTGKFDTFYLDSTAQLTATAAGCQVERMELTGTNTFRMDEDGDLFYAESYNPGDKVTTKGTLRVYLEGYQVPVEKTVTVATTKTAPKLTLNPTASIINTAVEDPECRVKVLWNGKALDLTDADVTTDVGFAAVEAKGQYLTFRLTGGTGGTAKLSLRLPGWAQAVSLTHKITVDTKLPTVKLAAPTLKLNSLFSAQTAETSVWLTQGNLDISTMDFVSAREEGERIALSFDPETDTIQAKFKDIPKAGTYSYTYTAYLEDGTALPSGTLKVTVAAAAPKVKLSAASVKLNRCLAGQEKATVKVTLTGGTGYQVTDFEGLPEYMSYEAGSGELTVILPDGNFTGETCNLYPIVRDEESGQEVRLSTKLTLKVQTVNTSKLTVSLSAKGKLDTVNPDSAIAYTVTKVNNCLGTVDGVSLEGTDGALFQADLDTSGAKPVVLLRLLPGESYATDKTYKVQFCFTVCGAEVRSSVLSVKVAQTALKATGPKSAVYYLAQSGPMRCSLNANLPLESVSLSAKTAKEFQQALGGEENLRLVGNRLEFRLANPGALTAGKSYSVQLELLPENAAENTKPTTVKLTVKVMK